MGCHDDGNPLGRLLPCQGWREWGFCRDDGNHLSPPLPCQGWREWEFCPDECEGPQ